MDPRSVRDSTKFTQRRLYPFGYAEALHTDLSFELQSHCLKAPTYGLIVSSCEQEQEVSISGWNWGNAAVDTATMVFTVGSKPAFRIPLKDVNQVQQSKEEVRLLPAAGTKRP